MRKFRKVVQALVLIFATGKNKKEVCYVYMCECVSDFRGINLGLIQPFF